MTQAYSENYLFFKTVIELTSNLTDLWSELEHTQCRDFDKIYLTEFIQAYF